MATTVGTLEIKLLANIARLQTDMDRANQTVDRAMKGIDRSVGLAKRAFGGFLSLAGGAQILRMVDDYKKFDAQLRLSTRTTQEYAAAYKSVVAIARQSQSDIAAVGVLYARLTNNLRDFGTSQKEIAGITEAVSLSLRVSNATVQETNSVMLQLSQSFGSGRINGQEFLAVSEGAPIIMRQLAKSLNTTVGALKDMSAAGQLTSDVLAKALSDPEYVARLREQVKEVGTISSAWVVFINNLKVFVGEADKSSGAAKILQSAIIGVGESLQFLVSVAMVAAGVAFTRWVGSLYDAAKAQAAEFAAGQRAAQQKLVLARAAVTLAEANYRTASAIGASTLALNNNAAATTNAARAAAVLTAAQARLAAATTAASTTLGVFRGAVAFLGGPIGAIITALGLGYIAFKQFGEKSGGEMEELKRIVRELNAEIEKTPALIKSKVVTSFEELAKVRDKLERDLTRAKRGKIDFSTGEVFVDEAEVKRIQGLLDATLVRYQELVGKSVEANEQLKEAASEAMQAEKFLREEKIKLMSEEIAAQEKIIEAAKKANISEADRAAIIKAAQGQIDTLRGKAEKETKASKEAREAMIAYFERTNEAIVKQIELREKLFQEDEAYIAEQRNAQIGVLEGVYEAISAKEKEIAEYDKLESAIQATALSLLVEKKYRMVALGASEEQIALIDEEIAARKKLLDLTIGKERIEAEKKAAEESKRIWEKAEEDKRRAMERTASELSRSITDALMRGFEDGKSIAKNFRETLKNMFNTLILRPVIEAIVKPVAVGLGGIFSTEAVAGTGGGVAGGGFNGLLSQGKNLLQAVTNGFDSLNSSLVSSIGDLGTFLSTGNGGLGDVLGGFIGQYSSQIANVLPFAGAAFSLLSGNVKGAVSQGAGAGIGMAIGGPVGGLIGGALGSVVGGLFGGSGERFEQSGESRAAILSGGKLTLQQKEFSGSRMSGAKSSLDTLNETFLRQYNAILNEFGGGDDNARVRSTVRLRRTSGALATSFYMPDGGGKLNREFGQDANIDKAFKQFTKTVLGKYLGKAILRSDIPSGIKKFFSGLKNPTAVNETIDGLVRMNKALRDLPPVFDAIDFALFTTKFNVGIKQLQEDFGAVQKYTELFYTQQENFDTFLRQLTAQFGDLGQAFPTTREGFRELVDGINVIDESSYNLFQALVRLAPAMDQYYQALDQQLTVLRGIEDFRTRADYQIYSGLMRNYGAAAANDRFPMFADGGSHTGGMRVVGERGPELEMTGPSRIIPTSTIMDALSGNSALALEIRALRMEMQAVVSNTGRSALYNRRVSDLLDRVTPDGDAIRTEAVA